jgi:hypothetical protein
MESPDQAKRNWDESDLPIPMRLAVAMRNNAIKLARRSTCCGHHGEPGC